MNKRERIKKYIGILFTAFELSIYFTGILALTAAMAALFLKDDPPDFVMILVIAFMMLCALFTFLLKLWMIALGVIRTIQGRLDGIEAEQSKLVHLIEALQAQLQEKDNEDVSKRSR